MLFTFQRHLPLEGDTDLLKHFDFCYERSDRLRWSAERLAYPGFGGRAVAENSPVLTRKLLEQTAWSVCQCQRMANEALEGEADLAENDEDRGQSPQIARAWTRHFSAARLFRRRLKQSSRITGHEAAASVNVSLFETLLASVMEPRMPVREIAEYETWTLEKAEVPPRTRLYHLRPVGFGTGLVESLTSYFSRLAEAHSSLLVR